MTLTLALAAALVVALLLLLRERRRSMRKINFLLDAVASGDYTFKFSVGQGLWSRLLGSGVSYRNTAVNASLNRIVSILQDTRNEAIEREKYYELIINQVNTGILVIDEQSNVLQSNQEARRLLGMETLTHTKQLARIDEHLQKAIETLRPNDKTRTGHLNERGNVHLLLRASTATLRGKPVRIIALNDINAEMDDNQQEAWNKLIRVLTHEIMNTVTPITSLSETLLGKLSAACRTESLEFRTESLEFATALPTSADSSTDSTAVANSKLYTLNSTLESGLETIHRTSRDLLHFVENYRRLTHLPTPSPRLFYVKQFAERMRHIALEQAQQLSTITQHPSPITHHPSTNTHHPTPITQILLDIDPSDLLLYADESLISHVVTNLLKNAIQAIATSGQGGTITLHAYTNADEAVIIDITNDGPLIPPEVADHIFVPFFTTKTDGSGIGLSVSRQIMKLSGGTLTLSSDRKLGLTTFSLTFP